MGFPTNVDGNKRIKDKNGRKKELLIVIEISGRKSETGREKRRKNVKF